MLSSQVECDAQGEAVPPESAVGDGDVANNRCTWPSPAAADPVSVVAAAQRAGPRECSSPPDTAMPSNRRPRERLARAHRSLWSRNHLSYRTGCPTKGRRQPGLGVDLLAQIDTGDAHRHDWSRAPPVRALRPGIAGAAGQRARHRGRRRGRRAATRPPGAGQSRPRGNIAKRSGSEEPRPAWSSMSASSPTSSARDLRPWPERGRAAVRPAPRRPGGRHRPIAGHGVRTLVESLRKPQPQVPRKRLDGRSVVNRVEPAQPEVRVQ